MIAQQRDRTESEVAWVHHAKLRHMQCAVRFDALDQHGQFVHVRHDPCRAAPGNRVRPVPVVARLSIGSADVADEVAGVVGPHVVDQGLQLAGADGPHRFFLAARPVGPEQFLQQVVGGVLVAIAHMVPSHLRQP